MRRITSVGSVGGSQVTISVVTRLNSVAHTILLMVRAVKTKAVRSLAKGQSALLLPGATTAEPWEAWVFGAKDGEPELVQTCATPLENRLRARTASSRCPPRRFSACRCAPERDRPEAVRRVDSAADRDARPATARRRPGVFDFNIVAQEAERTLVMVGLLPSMLPADLHAEVYDQFDLSVRCLPLPPNALTLWSEHDRLNFAITRGSSLVYYQALTDNAINTRVGAGPRRRHGDAEHAGHCALGAARCGVEDGK